MKTLILCTIIFLSFSACGSGADQHTATVISPQQAREMMLGNDLIIIDVRSEQEFQAGHIPGAILLPYDIVREEAAALFPDLGQTFLLYCQSGRRSNIAANAMAEMGYSSVYDFGGIMAWEGEINIP